MAQGGPQGERELTTYTQLGDTLLLIGSETVEREGTTAL